MSTSARHQQHQSYLACKIGRGHNCWELAGNAMPQCSAELLLLFGVDNRRLLHAFKLPSHLKQLLMQLIIQYNVYKRQLLTSWPKRFTARQERRSAIPQNASSILYSFIRFGEGIIGRGLREGLPPPVNTLECGHACDSVARP